MHSTTRHGISRIAVTFLAAAAALAPVAAGAETALKGTASLALASRYVWRGQTLSEGFVAQPTVGLAYGGFTANLWSNVDLDADATEEALGDADDDGIFMNETDLTLAYAFAAGPLSLSAGFIHYAFPASDTQEIYLTASYPTLLNPTLSLYYDLDEGEGGFAILALSQGIPVGSHTLTAGGSLGFNIDDKAMGADASGEEFTGLYYGEVYLATSIPLLGRLSLDPRVAYAFGIGDGRDAIGALSVDGRKDVFYASLAATIAF